MAYYAILPRTEEVYHFGIKRRSGRYPYGSGERPYQREKKGVYLKTKGFNPNALKKGDTIIFKKGEKVSRLTLSSDEHVKDFRKYVSLTKAPEEKWERLFSRGYAAMGFKYIYENQYKTLKNMSISTMENNEKEFYNWLSDHPENLKLSVEAVKDMSKRNKVDFSNETPSDAFFKTIGWNYSTSSSFLKYMKDKGYDAMADTFGIQSGGDKSVIVFDPEKTLKLKKQKTVRLR